MKADSSPVSLVQVERLSCFLVRRRAMDSLRSENDDRAYGENFKLGSALIEFALLPKGNGVHPHQRRDIDHMITFSNESIHTSYLTKFI